MVTVILLSVILAGCVPNIDKQDEVVQENDKTEEKAIVPKYQISDSYYRTLSPFKPSSVRGMVVNNLHTRYDSDEFEEGLLRIAQRTFSTETYIFQEGQYIDKETVTGWLRREMTAGQLKSNGLDESENIGLNPLLKNPESKEEHEKNPIYLSHILEHNYLIKSDDKTVKLGGVAIGLALNSVYYFKVNGTEHEVVIPDNVIKKEGQKIAEELIKRLRQIKGLESVPITIGLFKQQEKTSVIPGNYFSYAVAKQDSSSLEWFDIDEKYVLFPSNQAKDHYLEDSMQFEKFQTEISKYFENYNGIVGRALYMDKELKRFTIDINMQFYGKAEVIGFAQYIAGLIVETFPEYATTEVRVQSFTGPEALILKEPDMDEPFVHIY